MAVTSGQNEEFLTPAVIKVWQLSLSRTISPWAATNKQVHCNGNNIQWILGTT